MTVPSQPPPPDLEALLAHREWVKKLASHISSPDLADDTAQDAWVIALERSPQHVSNLRGWWRAVVRSVNVGRHRSDGRRVAREEKYQSTRSSADHNEPAQVAERIDTFKFLATAVAELDEPFGSTIFLHYFEGLSPREISEQQSTPIQTVHSRLRRGVLKLREKFRATHPGDWRSRCLAISTPFSISKASPLIPLVMKKPAIAGASLALAWTTYFLLQDPGDSPSSLTAGVTEPLSESSIEELAEATADVNPSMRNHERSPSQEHAKPRPEFQLPDGVRRDASVLLRFLDSTGKPWPKLKVQIFGKPRYAFTDYYFETNQKGEVHLACISGDPEITILSNTGDGGSGHSVTRNLELAPGEKIELEMKHPGWKSFSGFVLDSKGEAITDAPIIASSDLDEFEIWDNRNLRTDNNGEFQYQGTAGQFAFEVRAPQKPWVRFTGSSDDSQIITGIRLQIPESRVVSLRVLDSLGKPLKGATVRYRHPRGHSLIHENEFGQLSYFRQLFEKTSDNGLTKIFAGVDREWPLELSHKKIGKLTFSLPVGVTDFTYKLPLGNTFPGQVTDEGGNGIANAKVYAWAPKDSSNSHGFPISPDHYPPRLADWTPTTTGADGEFLLSRLTSSEYGMLLIEAPGKLTRHFRNLTFPSGRELSIEMQPGFSISGSYFDAGGNARDNIKVYLSEPEINGLASERNTLQKLLGRNPIYTAQEGKFSFLGLAPGQYELTARTWDSGVVLATAIVQAGNEDVVLRKGDGMEELMNFAFTVFDAHSGEAIPQFNLRFITATETHSTSRNLELPLSGKVHHKSFGHMPEAMALVISRKGYQSWIHAHPGEAGNYSFEVLLEPATRAKILLQDADGNPVLLMQAKLVDANGQRFGGGSGAGAARELAFPDQGEQWHISQAHGEVNIHSVPDQGGFIRLKRPAKLSHSNPDGTIVIPDDSNDSNLDVGPMTIDIPLPDPKPIYPEPIIIVVPEDFMPEWKSIKKSD